MQTISAASKRLYGSVKNRMGEIGIPISHLAKRPAISADTMVTLPGGVMVRKRSYDAFNKILGDFQGMIPTNRRAAAMRELAAKLLALHRDDVDALRDELHEEYRKPVANQWENARKAWRDAFNDDPAIGRNRRETTLNRAKAVLKAYASAVGAEHGERLRAFLAQSGGNDHVEMIRFLDWIGGRISKAGAKS